MPQGIFVSAAVLFGELMGAFIELGSHGGGLGGGYTELLQGTGEGGLLGGCHRAVKRTLKGLGSLALAEDFHGLNHIVGPDGINNILPRNHSAKDRVFTV